MIDHVLLCATDAGGASNLAPLVPGLIDRDIQPFILTRPSLSGWFSHYGSDTDVAIHEDSITEQHLSTILETTSPLAYIGGTSRYKSPERMLTILARKQQIPSTVVLDEWYNYRLRFASEEDGALKYLPNAICLPDESAQLEAVEEGLPLERCHITGSPALARVLKTRLGFIEEPPARPPILAHIEDHPVITFLSETHSTDYGTGSDSPGSLGPYIGYTEITVREKLMDVVDSLDRPLILVEKLHPAANHPYSILKQSKNVSWQSLTNVDLWSLLWHSDLVIGMRSIALLEAYLLGRPTCSFQPGMIGAERCKAVRLGLIPRFESGENLSQWCIQQLSKPDQQNPERFRFAHEDAVQKVLNVALGQ